MSFTVTVPSDFTPSAGLGPSEPIPTGNYEALLFDIKAEEVKSGLNAGKPRWNIQFKIDGGQFDNRRVFSYIPMYVAGDFWKFENFFSSLGFEVKGQFSVPEIKDLLGKKIGVRVKVREAEGAYPASNEVSGFNKPSTGADALASVSATEVWAE